ncbi:uncharacterized protein Dwil_GK20360 [Drosophila willistoni]|uniref:Pickpocket protein 28 n=1 Tax=Drosophila willistoni TaxID=7260 RepID=B4MXR0_DROWI|nr:pickpocket protein 28 [Drosophila willistoni]EDW76829.2 uncharacterized protein Dwil_GK20360 [Drosophila willistoni]
MTLLHWLNVKFWNNGKSVKEFLQNTSLQGLKYVWQADLPNWIRLFFGLIFLVVVNVAINLSVNVFKKWQSTPVIIGISSAMIPISEIPFPAITVCNMNQGKHSKVDGFLPGSLDHAMLQKSCFMEMNYTSFKNAKRRFKNDTFPNFIINISEKCSEMIVSCTFQRKKLPCSDIFREIFIDEGLCCVFNLLHPYYLYKFKSPFVRDYTSTNNFADIAVDWNPMTGYPKTMPTGFYPRAGVDVGVTMGLQIVLDGHINDYYCSSTNGEGFKVLLYNPIDQPNIKESGLPVMLGRQTSFRIIARSFEAVPNIRGIHRTKRQCIFSDEQELLFYRYYTRRNCESECDALYYLRHCECIPYHLPFIYTNATLCNVSHFDCLNRAEVTIFDTKSVKCKESCLTSCHDLQFFPDTFSAPFSQAEIRAQNEYLKNLSPEYMRENLAVVNFYHSENHFRSNVKTSYTGTTEYMSLTGGIMSLMVGFSVVFLAEVLYYSFLRIFLEHIRVYN